MSITNLAQTIIRIRSRKLYLEIFLVSPTGKYRMSSPNSRLADSGAQIPPCFILHADSSASSMYMYGTSCW